MKCSKLLAIFVVILLCLGTIMTFVPQVNATELNTYALSFDGINDKVVVSDHASLNFSTEDFTISCWIKIPVDYPPLDTCVMRKINVGTTYVGWLIEVTAERTVLFWLQDELWNIYIAYTPVIPNTFEWHYICFTKNSTTSVAYADLQSNITQNVSLLETLDTPDPLLICYADPTYSQFDLDEIRLYNRCLNSTEMSYAYNSGMGRYAPMNTTDLVAWYKFDENFGSTLYDRSGNGNHGALTGGTWVSGITPDWYDVSSENLYIQPDYNGTLSQVSYTQANSLGQSNLSFLISGTDNSTTKVYCANKGKPVDVYINETRQIEDVTWDYNNVTKISEMNITLASSVPIVVLWIPQNIYTVPVGVAGVISIATGTFLFWYYQRKKKTGTVNV